MQTKALFEYLHSEGFIYSFEYFVSNIMGLQKYPQMMVALGFCSTDENLPTIPFCYLLYSS